MQSAGGGQGSHFSSQNIPTHIKFLELTTSIYQTKTLMCMIKGKFLIMLRFYSSTYLVLYIVWNILGIFTLCSLKSELLN